MARSARLVARVVLVPAGAGAAEARRRVADVLLRAAISASPHADDVPLSDAAEPAALPGPRAR